MTWLLDMNERCTRSSPFEPIDEVLLVMTLSDEQLLASRGPWFPSQLTAMNGWLYFEAYTPIAGYELWRSDGRSTEQVSNIKEFC